MFPILLATIVISVLLTRSSGIASLATFTMILVLSIVWPLFDLPTGWGIEDTRLLLPAAAGLVLVLAPKHLRDARQKLREPSLP